MNYFTYQVEPRAQIHIDDLTTTILCQLAEEFIFKKKVEPRAQMLIDDLTINL